MDWSLLFSSYASVFLSPQVLLMTLLGATGGVLLGAIPGMTATMGVALLIPFSFGMDLSPLSACCLASIAAVCTAVRSLPF
jgi:putative tricarboxylic transport membrane protein